MNKEKSTPFASYCGCLYTGSRRTKKKKQMLRFHSLNRTMSCLLGIVHSPCSVQLKSHSCFGKRQDTCEEHVPPVIRHMILTRLSFKFICSIVLVSL